MKKLFSFLTNKYLLAISGFAVWMFFFDQNDVVSMQQRKKELQDTKDNIAYLNKEIAMMEKDKEDLSSNPQRLEQFAREQYHLKRDNEDVYIIDK